MPGIYMNDDMKTNEHFLSEITALKKRLAELETAQNEYRQASGARSALAHREPLHMLQLILDTIPQRVFWKDRNYFFIGCNLSFAHDAGLTDPQEVIGKNDFDLPWKNVAPLYRSDDQEVMDSDMPKLDFEEPQIAQTAQHDG